MPLVGRDKLHFLSTSGFRLNEIRREEAFCTQAILGDEPLIVEDAAKDARFEHLPFVSKGPHVHFYAGVPLRLKPGINIGTLSIIDFVPRQLSAEQQAHLIALAGIIVDEIRGRQAARELNTREKRLAQTARMAKICGYELSQPSGKLTWDDGVYPIFGIPEGTPPAHELIISRYDPDMREKSRARLNALFNDGIPYDVELRGTRPNGEVFWIRSLAEAETSGGQVMRVYGAIQDITERKRAEERMHELAFRDLLTGLPNRASFLDKLNHAIANANGARVDLIQFNVDHFRDVNDALGHQIGDTLLQRIASGLWQTFGAIGTVARIGGDEFAVIVRGEDWVDEAGRLAEEFIEQTRGFLRQDNYSLPLCISAGSAVYPAHGEDAETIMKNAKVALLEAKARTPSCLVRFDPTMRSAIDEKTALIRRIWAGIENNEFVLFYQPIVGLRGGKVTGLEALMRWKDPERGILTPAHFMVAFEEQDLSVALGDVGLNLAIAQMRAWLDAGVDFGSVAVNLSTAQFHLPDLADIILQKLARAEVPPQRLTLEVTENVYMAWGADVVAATLRKLHEAGVGIALDDFGTGYASLAHLRQFPIDKLKIDKSFVQSAESAAIVDAVINMGMSLGMQVVAEGVEKAEQVNCCA